MEFAAEEVAGGGEFHRIEGGGGTDHPARFGFHVGGRRGGAVYFTLNRRMEGKSAAAISFSALKAGF